MKLIFTFLLTLTTFWIYGQCDFEPTVNWTDPTCFGSADGSAIVDVTGGTPPYAYLWDTGDMTQQVNGLVAGCYNITVSDATACEEVVLVCLNEQPPILIDNLILTNANCGSADGTAIAEVSGGDGNYTYQWGDPFAQTTPTAIGLIAGTYYLTVTDGNGCNVVETFTILDSPSPIIDDLITTNVDCSNATGTATVFVSGGDGNYTYQWDDPLGQTASTAIGLSAGTYNVTVIDGNGCIVIGTFTILDSPPPVVTVEGNTVGCGEEFATVSAVVTGGATPYTYLWSNGSNASNAQLWPGMYTLWIIDANGCEVEVNFTVDTSIGYTLNIISASCDAADGIAEVITTGSSVNLDYAWSTGGTGQTETGLAQGWYSVTVTDLDDGCYIRSNFYVDEDISCKVVLGGYLINDDANPDCTDDADATRVQNVMVLLDNGQATFTDVNGYYEFILDPGNYQVEFIPDYQYNSLCPASGLLSVSLPNDGMVSTNNDFYVEYSNYQDISIGAYSGLARPGFIMENTIIVCNNGGGTIDNGTLTFVHDTILTGTNTDPVADNYDASTYTYTWNYSGLEPNDCIPFTMYGLVPIGTPLGTLINSSAVAGPLADDVNSANNSVEWHQIVTGSYDPNDKRGFIGGASEWGGDILEEDTWFNYNLRFQNVGTDTAFTVVVRDTLDLNVFDITSIEVGPSSHPYSLQFEDDNVLVFWFENIDLVDSTTNEPDSHGFTSFSISRFPDLPIGTEISNSAAIFFDFNAPVITNTTVHTISNPVGVNDIPLDIEANIYPNPVTDETVLTYQLDKTETVSISVIDQLGRTCFSLLENEMQTAGNYTVPILGRDLPSGVYLLQIMTQNGQLSKKFVK